MTKRILLTDDDELVLISLEELLLSRGYEVVTASSGKAALEAAAGAAFDLVILDVVMPGMSGFDVCRALRQQDGYRETPVVMLTAKSAPADREAGLAAGASVFLPKPIHPDRLLQTIEAALAGAPPAPGPR